MIQFNLLPDVKVEYIKTHRRKRLIIFASIVSSAATFAIFIVLFLFVRVSQTAHLKDLNKDIAGNLGKIQSVEDLDKIITVQNQLNSLPELHDKKVITSRLNGYLTQVAPQQAAISNITLNFETNKATLRGETDSLATVNKFVDTLKFTDFKVNNSQNTSDKAFKSVVLDNFSIGTAGDTKTTYGISFDFNPAIFSVVKELNEGATEPVTLTVPKIISTRSETEKPNALFVPETKAPTQPEQR